MFLLSPLPRHFCLCLILQFLLPLFLLSSLRVSQGSILLPLLSCLRIPCRGLSLLLLAWALLRWFLWFLVYLRCSTWRSVIFCCLCFALLLLAPLWVSMALPLRCLGLLRLLVYLQFYSWALQGFQRPLLLLFFALLLLPPLRVSLAFPQLRLAPSLVSLALLLSLALLRLMLRCLGLLRLLPSSSLSVWLGSYGPFAPGLLLRSLPVLWLQVLRRLLFLLALFRGVLPDPSAPSRHVFLSSVERGYSTLGGYRSRGLFVR